MPRIISQSGSPSMVQLWIVNEFPQLPSPICCYFFWLSISWHISSTCLILKQQSTSFFFWSQVPPFFIALISWSDRRWGIVCFYSKVIYWQILWDGSRLYSNVTSLESSSISPYCTWRLFFHPVLLNFLDTSWPAILLLHFVQHFTILELYLYLLLNPNKVLIIE